MKDYANPLFMFLVVGAMAWRSLAGSEASATQAEVWLLTLCAVGVVTNGALALARAIMHRPSLAKVVWAVVFMVIGCCAWVTRLTPLSEEQAIYAEQSNARQNPLIVDEEGESLFTRAAALGKTADVETILNTASPTLEQMAAAALRAAENDKVDVLILLARHGVSANASVNGTPLLHAAAQNAACEAMDWLIMSGALPDGRDEGGSTALIQAAMSDSAAAVKVLLGRGADPKLRDMDGKRAADYARSPEVAELLNPGSLNSPES